MANDENLKAELEKAVAECERLREENARLKRRVGQAPDTLAPTPNQFSAHNNKKAKAIVVRRRQRQQRLWLLVMMVSFAPRQHLGKRQLLHS